MYVGLNAHRASSCKITTPGVPPWRRHRRSLPNYVRARPSRTWAKVEGINKMKKEIGDEQQQQQQPPPPPEHSQSKQKANNSQVRNGWAMKSRDTVPTHTNTRRMSKQETTNRTHRNVFRCRCVVLQASSMSSHPCKWTSEGVDRFATCDDDVNESAMNQTQTLTDTARVFIVK